MIRKMMICVALMLGSVGVWGQTIANDSAYMKAINERTRLFAQIDSLTSPDRKTMQLFLDSIVQTFDRAEPAGVELHNVAYWYNEIGDYPESEKYYLEALAVYEKTLGKSHPDYATSLGNLALLYYNVGNYQEAEKYYLESLTIKEQVLGKLHPSYATSLNNLAVLYRSMGNYQEAEKYHLEALTIEEQVLGKSHPDYAISLDNLAGLYKSMGNYQESEKYYLEALAIIERALGKSHPDYAISLGNLADLYESMGNYQESEKYHLEALTIEEQVLGKSHPSYAISLGNLAILYESMGNYQDAEKYHLEALAIKEQVLGKLHPYYAASLNGLAILYNNMGNYQESEKYHLEALAIKEQALGKSHPNYAASLNNLAVLYVRMGNYQEAEKYHLEALTIEEQVLGKSHPDHAISLGNLAILYVRMGNYQEAEKYYLESLTIKEQVLGKSHPYYAASLSGLALLYNNIGNYQESEKYHLEALPIQEQALGKSHPNYATSLNGLAALYLATRNYTQATKTKTISDSLNMSTIGQNFSFLSEKQRTAFWKNIADTYEVTYSLPHFSPQPATTSLAYNNTLFTKALLLRTNNAIRDAIYGSGNRQLITQYEALGSLRQQIDVQQKRSDGNKLYVENLRSRADSLDKVLTIASSAFREAKADIRMTWKEVQNKLAADEAAIEFVSFTLYNKQWTDTTLYAAMVLRPGMEAPQWINLCRDDQLRQVLESKDTSTWAQINNLYVQQGDAVYDLVWQPLEKALQGVKAIYYSPAGLLHKIALGALPVGTTDNQLLQDRYNMHLVSSTREVNRLKKENANMMATDRVTLYGGLQYDHRPTAPSLAKTTSAATQSYIHHHHRSFNVAPPHLLRGAGDVPDGWNYLEGTRTETREIVSVLQQKRISNRYYSGTNGKEETFKALSGTPVHVIHLATHGFFLPDVVVKRRPELAQMLGGDDEERVVENPLLRSGLVLSGVNKAWMAKEPVNAADEEDGILTADEISKLNLTKTKLVVLSACETGLGDINNSEGVFGLQRAFKLAGAESLIMSLWKVPDEATSLLMRSFYEQWIGGASKQAAFKAAQKRVRERYVEPYYWAAFVMMD